MGGIKIFIAIALYVIIAIIFVVVETIIETKEKWWKIDEERIIIRGPFWPIVIFINVIYLIIDYIRERFK